MYRFFPPTEYNGIMVTDITKRFQFSDKFRASSYVENYTVRDGETPESLSYALYKDTQYSWIILMLNYITDRNNEWPYSYNELQNVLNNKYSGSSFFLYDGDIDFSFSKVHYFVHRGTRYDVKSVNRNLNKITSDIKITGFLSGDTVSLFSKDGGLIKANVVPRRIVYEDIFSLHHFEKDGLYADPRELNLEANATLLLQYINQEAEEYAVKNIDYETIINDEKREILLTQEDQLENILKDVQGLFDGIDKSYNIVEVRQTLGDISE